MGADRASRGRGARLVRARQGDALVQGAERVAELPLEVAEEFARKLWVVPPGGSLL